MTSDTHKDLVKRLRDREQKTRKAVKDFPDSELAAHFSALADLNRDAADTIERLTASAPVDGDLREKIEALCAAHSINFDDAPQADRFTDAILALLPARTPEADADAWMAICNETGGRLFAHTKERAEIRGREAYGKIYGHAGHAFEVVPLYAAANLLRTPAGRPDREAVEDLIFNELGGDIAEAGDRAKKITSRILALYPAQEYPEAVRTMAKHLLAAPVQGDEETNSDFLLRYAEWLDDIPAHDTTAKAILEATSLSPQAGVSVERKAWLIERSDTLEILYMDWLANWVDDIESAMQFGREEDAENFNTLFNDEGPSVQFVEHMWCDGKPRPASKEAAE